MDLFTITHLICYRAIPHPTHHYRSPNSHGVQTFLLEGRQHRHHQQSRCRSPSPPTIRTHTTSQGVRPPTRSGSRPYVPAVQGGATKTIKFAAEMPKSRCLPATRLVVLRPYSESSRPTPRRCWRSLGPPRAPRHYQQQHRHLDSDVRVTQLTAK